MRLKASPSKVLMLTGGTLIAVTGIAAQLRFPDAWEGYVATLRIFVPLAILSGILYLASVATILRVELPKRALWGILLVAGLMRLIVLPMTPMLSTDVYRYVWDGRVQAAGINPYRYIPQAPELTFLRDETIYPNINRAYYARTIYPPVAEALYFLVARASPTVFAMKAAMVAFEILVIIAVFRLLDDAGLPRMRVLIYAWNPLAVWEFAGNGHVDSAAIGFIALALLARSRRRMVWTGAALGAATLVKFLPLVLFPALWRRWDLRMPAAFAFVVLVSYLCFVGAGRHILGFLPGYVSEEGLQSGSGIYYLFLLGQIAKAPPAWVYMAAVAFLLVGLGYRMAFLRPLSGAPESETLDVAKYALLLATALMVAITPHYPWYFAWLALPACLVPSYSVLYLTVAGFLLYFDPRHVFVLWRGVVYLGFPLLALAELWWRRRQEPAGPANPYARRISQ